jgi:predicted  nucleic acid-binding Zn-ribbon protein
VRETLRQLVVLQRVDDELAGVKLEVQGLPARCEAAEAERSASQVAAEAAAEALQARELEQRRLESELADAEEQIRRLQGQTSQVKSNEAYHALLSEIEAAKQAQDDLEERILESMEAVSELRDSLGGAEAQARATGARVDEELARIEARETELAKDQERLGAARDQAAELLDADARARYERVVERRRPGVAIISKEVCSGCRVGIPPQDFVEIISATSLHQCRTCKRLLVHRDMLGNAS